MAKDSLYIIGIGGTGAKCLEAVLRMAGLGLFPEDQIKMLFVDADETNGNVDRARTSLKIYQGCYELLKSGPNQERACVWMQTDLYSYQPDLWSPFGATKLNKDLESFFAYDNLTKNDPELGNLFDVLYTEDERKANLDVGFRGRPAIGSAVMSRLDLNNLDEKPWSSFIGQIKADTGGGKKPRIFLCGSIFGGTGASGLPTLGRLIHNKLDKENIRQSVKIACLFVLPYFQFQAEGDEARQKVYASSEHFLLNTEAALRYYRDQNEYFDQVYLLGNQNFSRYRFSIGKNTQRNEPHFIELYAGLAARHFLLNPFSPQNQNDKVVLSSRQEATKLGWGDLPEREEVQARLVNGVRFAYVWLSNILPELMTAKEIGIGTFSRGAPWFEQFFAPEKGFLGSLFHKKDQELPDFNDPLQQEAIKLVTNWCEDYLRWVREIHESAAGEIELFRVGIFRTIDGQVRGEFLRDLVWADPREEGRKRQDDIQKIKEQLNPAKLQTLNLGNPNTGVMGLAKALYILCEWS